MKGEEGGMWGKRDAMETYNGKGMKKTEQEKLNRKGEGDKDCFFRNDANDF